MKKILGSLALAALPLSALATTATAPAADAAVTPGHTAVTVEVAGCSGCHVTATSWKRVGGTQPWISAVRTVRDGKVVFYPPTGRTAGLVLTVVDDGSVNSGANPVAISRYAGTTAGQDVTAGTARTTRNGYLCWKGTTRSAATLQMTVDRFADTGLDGTRGYSIRPYLDPSVRTIGDRVHLYRGTYGVQDVPVCYSS